MRGRIGNKKNLLYNRISNMANAMVDICRVGELRLIGGVPIFKKECVLKLCQVMTPVSEDLLDDLIYNRTPGRGC